MVRAKFTVQKVERTLTVTEKDGKRVPIELNTIVLQPVYSADPERENRKSWLYSPSGELRLRTINPEVAPQFELGGEYYVDFTRAG